MTRDTQLGIWAFAIIVICVILAALARAQGFPSISGADALTQYRDELVASRDRLIGSHVIDCTETTCLDGSCHGTDCLYSTVGVAAGEGAPWSGGSIREEVEWLEDDMDRMRAVPGYKCAEIDCASWLVDRWATCDATGCGSSVVPEPTPRVAIMIGMLGLATLGRRARRARSPSI